MVKTSIQIQGQVMQICVFEGRLGMEPEKRMTPSGKAVVNLNMAVTKRQKGESRAIWVPLTFWEKSAELVEQYCKKGSRLMVRAEFDMQDWTDKDNNKRQSPKFTVYEMEFLDSKEKSGQQDQSDNFQNNQRQPSNDFVEDD
jgi:single-strand DNA-binding protein